MRFVIPILLLIFLLSSCSNQDPKKEEAKKSESTNKPEKSNKDDDGTRRDSLTSHASHELKDNETLLRETEEMIRTAHAKRLEEKQSDFGKDLQLKGEVSFENEELVILSFEEIVEFGSWMYSNSSVFYAKTEEGHQLLKPTIKTTELNWGEETDLQYPGRINGVFKKAFDLTNNGKKDFIMEASGGYRTNQWETSFALIYDDEKMVLKILDLKAHSELTVGECSDAFGIKETFEIIEPEAYGGMPMVKIKGEKSECVEDQIQVNETYSSVWVFDPDLHQFKEFK